MSNLVSIPTSLRNRLAQAQTIIQSPQPEQGLQMLAQIGVELARTQPELLGLLIASQLGKSEFVMEQSRVETRTVTVDKKVLGMTYGQDVHTETKRTTDRRKIGLY